MHGQLNKTVKEKLREKAYRDAYVESHIEVGIPHQIRVLREQKGREWSQAELGRRCGKPANVISRLEDPEYGSYTIRTLLQIASACDVALLVKFVSYSRFLGEFEDVSPTALEVPSFTSDPGMLQDSPQPLANNLSGTITYEVPVTTVQPSGYILLGKDIVVYSKEGQQQVVTILDPRGRVPLQHQQTTYKYIRGGLTYGQGETIETTTGVTGIGGEERISGVTATPEARSGSAQSSAG